MYWKIFSVVLASMIKTLFAPTIGFAAGLSFTVTFVATAIGAIFLFDKISNFYYKNRKKEMTVQRIKRARWVVTMRQKYPIWLFVFMLPVTSIPVMAVIVRRFFHHNKPVFALSIFVVIMFALVGCLIFSPIQYL